MFLKDPLLKNLYKYRHLLGVFIWREFSIRYRQSMIGILWAVIQPLSMMLLFTFIFGIVLKYKVSNYPHVLFFYSGLLPWSFFAGSINFSISSLVSHRNLITKIYFPREIMPVSGIAVSFIDFCIAFVIYLILVAIYKIPLTINFLWFFPLLLLLLMFTTSLGIFLSALNVYYRDVKLLSGFLLQLWFFATPVFYSIDKVSMKWKMVLFLNPLTFIVENMRRCTLEGRGVVLWQLGLELVVITCFYIFSRYVFIKLERKMADVI